MIEGRALKPVNAPMSSDCGRVVRQLSCRRELVRQGSRVASASKAWPGQWQNCYDNPTTHTLSLTCLSESSFSLFGHVAYTSHPHHHPDRAIPARPSLTDIFCT